MEDLSNNVTEIEDKETHEKEQKNKKSKNKKVKNKKEKKKKEKPNNKQQEKEQFDYKKLMLNHRYKELTEKIEGMGYSYSTPALMRTLLFFSTVIIILSYFHKLHFGFIALLIAIFLSLIPISIFSQYKYLFEQKRFFQLRTYLKFMRLNFKQYGKILVALKETQDNFTEADLMYQCISSAINAIENGKDFREVLNFIEKKFKNSYLVKLHSYMILAESEGGESAYNALDTIDFESWESDTVVFQTQKYKYQNQNAIFTLLGLGISLGVVFIYNRIVYSSEGQEIFGDFFSSMSFQLSTFIYILVDLVCFVAIKSIITEKWVKEDE